MTAPDDAYDVAIVGARVAGSIVAALLAERGHRVLLLDRATFPSDTLSTHFFRQTALRAFRRVGVLDRVDGAAPHLMCSVEVIDGVASTHPVEVGADGLDHHLCVRRIVLDEILVRNAGERGAAIREGATFEGIRQARGASIVGWRDADGQHETRTRWLVGADGVYSRVAERVEASIQREEPVQRAMYYSYWSDVAPRHGGPAAEFHFDGDELLYVFPTDAGLTLLAISIPLARFPAFRAGPERELDAAIRRRSSLAERLAGARRVAPIRGTARIPGRRRVPFGTGWALVGDAAMVMDPFSGQGIDQGSTHAVLLADALDDVLAGRADPSSRLAAYHAAADEFSLATFERTCLNARDLDAMVRLGG